MLILCWSENNSWLGFVIIHKYSENIANTEQTMVLILDGKVLSMCEWKQGHKFKISNCSRSKHIVHWTGQNTDYTPFVRTDFWITT